jgi:hypothetical protein
MSLDTPHPDRQRVLSVGISAPLGKEVHWVRTLADAARAIACEDFGSAIVGSDLGCRAIELLVMAMAPLVELRPQPQWINLTGDDASAQEQRLSALAMAQGAGCLTAGELEQRLQQEASAPGHSHRRRVYLDPRILCQLEAGELDGGEFLGLALDVYRRNAEALVDQIAGATSSGRTAALRRHAHALMAVACEIGDLETTALAKRLSAVDQISQEALDAASVLPRTLEIACRSLHVYLSADGLCHA